MTKKEHINYTILLHCNTGQAATNNNIVKSVANGHGTKTHIHTHVHTNEIVLILEYDNRYNKQVAIWHGYKNTRLQKDRYSG